MLGKPRHYEASEALGAERKARPVGCRSSEGSGRVILTSDEVTLRPEAKEALGRGSRNRIVGCRRRQQRSVAAAAAANQAEDKERERELGVAATAAAAARDASPWQQAGTRATKRLEIGSASGFTGPTLVWSSVPKLCQGPGAHGPGPGGRSGSQSGSGGNRDTDHFQVHRSRSSTLTALPDYEEPNAILVLVWLKLL